MNWITILLKSSRKKKHIIKGIANIDDKHYLLDYVVFTNFQWYAAYAIEDLETFDKNNIKKSEVSLFYNVETRTFASIQDVPEEVLTNFKTEQD